MRGFNPNSTSVPAFIATLFERHMGFKPIFRVSIYSLCKTLGVLYGSYAWNWCQFSQVLGTVNKISSILEVSGRDLTPVPHSITGLWKHNIGVKPKLDATFSLSSASLAKTLSFSKVSSPNIAPVPSFLREWFKTFFALMPRLCTTSPFPSIFPVIFEVSHRSQAKTLHPFGSTPWNYCSTF